MDNLVYDNDDRAKLEDLCVTTKSLFMSLLAKNRQPNVPGTSFSVPVHRSRLPNMKLPKFSGKYSDYENLKNLFKKQVHNDPTLMDIEKVNHLSHACPNRSWVQ